MSISSLVAPVGATLTFTALFYTLASSARIRPLREKDRQRLAEIETPSAASRACRWKEAVVLTNVDGCLAAGHRGLSFLKREKEDYPLFSLYSTILGNGAQYRL